MQYKASKLQFIWEYIFILFANFEAIYYAKTVFTVSRNGHCDHSFCFSKCHWQLSSCSTSFYYHYQLLLYCYYWKLAQCIHHDGRWLKLWSWKGWVLSTYKIKNPNRVIQRKSKTTLFGTELHIWNQTINVKWKNFRIAMKEVKQNKQFNMSIKKVVENLHFFVMRKK